MAGSMGSGASWPAGGVELAPGIVAGAMRADEVRTLDEWAAAEGWNPGLADVRLVWDLDPEAFVAVREQDSLIAGGTILSYDGAFGFMGLFIVRPDRRGAGLGTRLWTLRRDRLLARLDPGASIGMDGVFAMVPFYERGGFRFAYRTLRFEGSASGTPSTDLVDLSALDFGVIEQFDRRFVPVARPAFLRRWVTQDGVHGAAVLDGDRVTAYGMVRPCRVGYKFGPVFADRPSDATRVIEHLMGCVSGARVQLDVPEPNAAALAIAQRFGLHESFGCARMYLGAAPVIPVEGIFGVTSFEFG
jgi:GNAT superfamily N-acetyltransferase